ncbi:MAG: exodeoxyribonuclease V subunit alpha [Sutterellaceae bacterium]|nr:exodeoxyribonuclease V subunit alpha [Sutterellaceae bacterium]
MTQNQPQAKDLSLEEQKAVRSANAQARLLVSALKRSGKALGMEDQALLAPVFAALDDAAVAGSVCVIDERFEKVSSLFGETRTLGEVLDRLLAKELIVKSDLPEKTPVSPLIADFGEALRLYDERNFYDELHLAQKIARLIEGSVEVPAVADPKQENDRAVQVALANRLTVVSGGPGTGKTTAVMKILKALMEKEPEKDLRITLAAPTGKAAGRMQQAVVAQAQKLENETMKAKLSELKAQTIHRLLLTPMPDGNRPSASAPLDCDVLVLDESSMIEIGLAVRLFDAVDENRTKVILLGDRFQLAAVGPGAVFADLSDTSGVLAKNISHLKFSHRFASDKAVGLLSDAINRGDVKAVMAQLGGAGDSFEVTDDNMIVWHRSQAYMKQGLSKNLRTWLDAEIAEIKALLKSVKTEFESADERRNVAKKVSDLMQRYGVLCAQRNGDMSVNAVNNYVDAKLSEIGFEGQTWRQIIVRKNDDLLGVHNGDVGVVVPGIAGATDDVYFPGEDGVGCEIKLGLLPEFQLAFAITIHQSQGSEYERVAVVMPTDADSGLATRELLYTAVTRVKDKRAQNGTIERYGTLDIFAAEKVLKDSVEKAVKREGALPERLELLVDSNSH